MYCFQADPPQTATFPLGLMKTKHPDNKSQQHVNILRNTHRHFSTEPTAGLRGLIYMQKWEAPTKIFPEQSFPESPGFLHNIMFNSKMKYPPFG